jgi:hypothetical protein
VLNQFGDLRVAAGLTPAGDCDCLCAECFAVIDDLLRLVEGKLKCFVTFRAGTEGACLITLVGGNELNVYRRDAPDGDGRPYVIVHYDFDREAVGGGEAGTQVGLFQAISPIRIWYDFLGSGSRDSHQSNMAWALDQCTFARSLRT